MTVIFSILTVIYYILTVILRILTEIHRPMTVTLTSATVIIRSIDVMTHQYCAIISPTSRALLLITVMKTYVVTSLIHNLSDKSIPDTRLHSFNIVSTISGTSVQGA